jgi:hypothetical protein
MLKRACRRIGRRPELPMARRICGSSSGPPMLPVLYNNHYQIVQTKDTGNYALPGILQGGRVNDKAPAAADDDRGE